MDAISSSRLGVGVSPGLGMNVVTSLPSDLDVGVSSSESFDLESDVVTVTVLWLHAACVLLCVTGGSGATSEDACLSKLLRLKILLEGARTSTWSTTCRRFCRKQAKIL